MDSVVETPLTAGHIHLFSKREPYQQKKKKKTLISLEMCTIISSKRESNQQEPFLPLDIFISPAVKGLSNRLPSLALFITTKQFNIRGLY